MLISSSFSLIDTEIEFAFPDTNYILFALDCSFSTHQLLITPQKPIKVQLLNSGRGIEVWLERSSSTFTSATATSATNTNTKSSDSIGLKTPPSLSPISQSSTEIDDQLILAKGPLSYAYKLYKIELHSSSSSLINFNQVIGAAAVPSEQSSSSSKSTKTETNPESLNLDEEEEEGKESSANLATAKTSEHLVGGHAFDGELQLHFYNKHSASSASEALRFASEGEGARPNLFAAVSVFIQTVTSKEETSVSLKSPLDFILDNLSAIPNESNTIELQLTRKHLQSLVTTSSEYLTYQGSMNRPPCVESVDWILLNRALRVDSSKFDGLFEKLNTNQENIRPVRPLNRRLLRTTISNLQVKIQGTLRKSDSPRDDAKSATRFQLCQSNEQVSFCSRIVDCTKSINHSTRPHRTGDFRFSSINQLTRNHEINEEPDTRLAMQPIESPPSIT